MFYQASPSQQDKEMREIRKDFYTNGNGKITTFYEPLEGRASYYQHVFKG